MENNLLKTSILVFTMFLIANISFSQNIFKEKYIEKDPSKRWRQNEISVSRALQILNDEFSYLKNNRTSFSYSIDDWDNTITKFVRSQMNNLPILNTNNLSDKNLKVLAFAKSNEILRIVDSKYYNVALKNPNSKMPVNFGRWNFIETIDGKSGWVFSNPYGSNFSNTSSINRPVYRSTSNYTKPKSFPWFWTIVISSIGIFLLTKLFSNSTYYGGYSSSSYNNYDNNSYERYTSYSQRSNNSIAKAKSSSKEEEEIFGYNDSTQYKGKSCWSEEKTGRTGKDGTTYKGKSWWSEEKNGRVDKDGNIHKGKSWWSEEKTGRVDKDGNIYKGKSWWTEEKVGRIDKDGTTYKGKSWWSEEKTGRSESNSSTDDDSCFLTTTCVKHKNLPDNCYELQVLRAFRDDYLGKFQEGIKHLKEYYYIAPEIVRKINDHPEKEIILDYLYESLVIKSIILISENKKEEAFLNYKEITNNLKSELITSHNSVSYEKP